MKLKEITKAIEEFAPLALQESYDNAGLTIGTANMEITGTLICLDITEASIDEAIAKNCNLIISHHPLIFKGIKKFTESNYIERTIVKAIQNNIAIYSAHTNIDSVKNGVSGRICDKLNIKNQRVLLPGHTKLKKIICFVPTAHAENLRTKLFKAGAGNIGNYSSCSYNLEGYGTFKAEQGSKPFVGKQGQIHKEKEERIELLYPSYIENKIINTIQAHHPYQEPAYDIITLDNKNQYTGLGMIGELEEEINTLDFLKTIKSIFKCGTIRHTNIVKNKIKTVAVCGGSGSSLLQNAISAQADIFITGDFKYHEFFDAENKIIIADIGHYESEQFTNEIFYEILTKKFTNFAVHISGINSNPINYL